MAMTDKQPLAALILSGLAKKGKAQSDPDEDKEDDSLHDHLTEISSDILDAIEAKDKDALADLLQEAFECLDASPHDEGEEDNE